ncbi:MAG: hypothetical protein R3B90_19830 [Planctomycetaceae bacterium]
MFESRLEFFEIERLDDLSGLVLLRGGGEFAGFLDQFLLSLGELVEVGGLVASVLLQRLRELILGFGQFECLFGEFAEPIELLLAGGVENFGTTIEEVAEIGRQFLMVLFERFARLLDRGLLAFLLSGGLVGGLLLRLLPLLLKGGSVFGEVLRAFGEPLNLSEVALQFGDALELGLEVVELLEGFVEAGYRLTELLALRLKLGWRGGVECFGRLLHRFAGDLLRSLGEVREQRALGEQGCELFDAGLLLALVRRQRSDLLVLTEGEVPIEIGLRLLLQLVDLLAVLGQFFLDRFKELAPLLAGLDDGLEAVGSRLGVDGDDTVFGPGFVRFGNGALVQSTGADAKAIAGLQRQRSAEFGLQGRQVEAEGIVDRRGAEQLGLDRFPVAFTIRKDLIVEFQPVDRDVVGRADGQ